MQGMRLSASELTASKPLELVHMDVRRPLPLPTPEAYKFTISLGMWHTSIFCLLTCCLNSACSDVAAVTLMPSTLCSNSHPWYIDISDTQCVDEGWCHWLNARSPAKGTTGYGVCLVASILVCTSYFALSDKGQRPKRFAGCLKFDFHKQI